MFYRIQAPTTGPLPPLRRDPKNRKTPRFIMEKRIPTGPELLDEITYTKMCIEDMSSTSPALRKSLTGRAAQLARETSASKVSGSAQQEQFNLQEDFDELQSGLRSPRHALFSAQAAAVGAVKKDKPSDKVLQILEQMESKLTGKDADLYLESLDQVDAHYRDLSRIMATSWDDMNNMVIAASHLLVGIRRIREDLQRPSHAFGIRHVNDQLQEQNPPRGIILTYLEESARNAQPHYESCVDWIKQFFSSKPRV